MREYHAWLARQLAENPPAAWSVSEDAGPGRLLCRGCMLPGQGPGGARPPLPAPAPVSPVSSVSRKRCSGGLPDAHPDDLARSRRRCTCSTMARADDRIHRMPPNLPRDRVAGPDAPQIRRAFRQALGLGEDDRLLLQLGSDFRRKGLDRSILALASLPESLLAKTWLYVVGDSPRVRYARLARRLGVADHVVFLGPRDDVPRILVAADLLVHPGVSREYGHRSAGSPGLRAGGGRQRHLRLRPLTSSRHRPAGSFPSPSIRTFQPHGAGGPGTSRSGRDRPPGGRLRPARRPLRHGGRRRRGHRGRGEHEGSPRPRYDDVYEANSGCPIGFAPCGKDATPSTRSSGCRARSFAASRRARRSASPSMGSHYFAKIHHGVGWREILKNLLHLKLPVLGAENEWRALNLLPRLACRR